MSFELHPRNPTLLRPLSLDPFEYFNDLLSLHGGRVLSGGSGVLVLKFAEPRKIPHLNEQLEHIHFLRASLQLRHFIKRLSQLIHHLEVALHHILWVNGIHRRCLLSPSIAHFTGQQLHRHSVLRPRFFF